MTPLQLLLPEKKDPTILCLGAHSDDLEIGAGATILGLAETMSAARIVWVVFAANGQRAGEARASAEYCVKKFAESSIRLHAYPDGFFPGEMAHIKEEFESLKEECDPDLILTHQRNDRHQDHQLISDITWQTFRNHLILEYEIPKYDGDIGSPNIFVPAPDHLREAKLQVLDRYFASQRSRSWFSRETFDAILRLRGIECNSASGYAEAFYCRKAVIDPRPSNETIP